MKKLAQIVSITILVLSASLASAQADSSNVPSLRGTPRLLPLSMQERETPVINNTTQVTQQVTQIIQPSISTFTGGGSGIRFANAYAPCNSGTLVGGGGSCRAANGYASMPTSQPNGNGWQVICDAFQGGAVSASAWATCSN